MAGKRGSTPELPQWIFRSALDSAQDIVLITEAEPLDRPGPKIVYANQAFYDLTGYTPEETIGNDPRMLQGEATDRAALDRIRAALVAREPVRVEVVNYAKSGQPYWLDLVIVPLRDPAGKVTHFAAIQRDITALKDLQRDLMQIQEETHDEIRQLVRANDVIEASRRQLHELDAEKTRLMSIIGHDLRNAFTSIIGYASLLEMRVEKLPPEQIAGEVSRLHRVVREAHRTMENLLAYSVMQRENVRLDLREVAIGPLVERVLGGFEERAMKKGITLEFPEVECGLIADEYMLEVVLRNLVENAIKFSNEGGRVCVEALDGDERPRIRISDTGIGMNDEQIRLMMERHRQEPSVGTADERGSGFGLALCGQLVHKMGGQLTVQSRPGQGSTFEMVFDRPR